VCKLPNLYSIIDSAQESEDSSTGLEEITKNSGCSGRNNVCTIASSNKQQATSNKQQATSNKQQATSNKQNNTLTIA